MRDYIIFTVGSNAYAVPVESVIRILPIPKITPMANAHPKVEGMSVYENASIKVVNFRKIANLNTHEEEIASIFKQVKRDHEIWVETLSEAVFTTGQFRLTTDPHACRLGKWLDSYTTHDPQVLAILRRLMPIHAALHETGKKILEIHRTDPNRAQLMLQDEIGAIYTQTTHCLNEMMEKADEISSQMQKMLIYQNGNEPFGIKVDTIDDIVVLEEGQIKQYERTQTLSLQLRTRGIVELNQKLVIVLDSIVFPGEENV
ncbi:MAG: chemotaxis protein CheW [Sulfuricurvum sp.]|nr:chemotaxis protein CheW [Sulfuricurvum sp.]